MKKLYLAQNVIGPILLGMFLSTTGCQKDEKLSLSPIIFDSSTTYGSISDQDGNTYKTVIIGSQTWMAENLKVTHYRNGDPIPSITSDRKWWNLTSTGACCDYNNSADFTFICGKLYNGYALNDSRNIAPEGWHVATQEDWETLINYLGGRTLAGGKLKETGTTHWLSPNTGATNETGFTALPCGFRGYNGKFEIHSASYWWSSTDTFIYYLHYKYAGCDYTDEFNFNYYLPYGFSVRCLKD